MKILTATIFFPRGGSAFVTRSLAACLSDRGHDVSLLTGSRTDLGDLADAHRFYAGADVHCVDFTAALASADPMAYDGPPMHGSFEDRPGAPDRIFAALSDREFERQVGAWARALEALDAREADVLHLHHLTPLHAAAARVAPAVPVVTHLHGTELLMLEAIAQRGPAAWAHAAAWEARLREWVAGSERIVVAPGNRARASDVLGIERSRFTTLANGFDPLRFRPLAVDRDAIWRRVLVEEPRGWRPGGVVGDVAYSDAQLTTLRDSTVFVYIGRFTEVKRLSLLLEAFAEAAPLLAGPASLVIVGGHPGEWEGEHPAAAIDRLGLDNVFLAGWHDHAELPELLAAADLLVLPSVRESFGQVIVEAMACGVPPLAAASLGPSRIIDDGETGWLFAVDSRDALVGALVDAVNRPGERERRGRLAEAQSVKRYAWPQLAARLEGILEHAIAAAEETSNPLRV
jgi:glycosyltransferase involved in cell wall biosynthesis